MKNGKKLTRDQKQIAKKLGLKVEEYLVERNTSEKIVFVHKNTGHVVEYAK